MNQLSRVLLPVVIGLISLFARGQAFAQDRPAEVESSAPAVIAGNETVIEVRIVGNESVSTASIISRVMTRQGREFDASVVEQDVRNIDRMRRFIDVKPKWYRQTNPPGVVVIYEVVERPTLREIIIAGNEGISDRALKKQVGLKPGDGTDPYAVERGRQKIDEYYRDRGFNKVRVSVLEGNRVGDKRAVYLINEGVKQRVRSVSFEGNTIVSGGRLKTKIKSKHGFLWLMKGYVDTKAIENDVDQLTIYYRSLGFFKAKIGRRLEYNESGKWLDITFVINEGPRSIVRDVLVVGNKQFDSQLLTDGIELTGEVPYTQSALSRDLAKITGVYEEHGYVFAEVEPETRFIDESGLVDLVYHITEGDRYRVNQINVTINGDSPHTRRHTVLTRLSIRPNDIVNMKLLRESERRLRSSQLFLSEPQRGITPQITLGEPIVETPPSALAKRPTGPAVTGFRGQSPREENFDKPRNAGQGQNGRTRNPQQRDPSTSPWLRRPW